MRSRNECWKFLSNERPNQLRWSHAAICLLCQLEWKQEQLRIADSYRAGVSRCGEWLRGICFVHFQSRCQEPISRGNFAAGGLLPDSVRPESQLHRKSEFPQLWASRRRARKRRLRDLFVGSYFQCESTAYGFSFLSLQQRGLSRRGERFPGHLHCEPGCELRRFASIR